MFLESTTSSTSEVAPVAEDKGVGQERHGGVLQLPEQLIRRHQLNTTEIKALPKFATYEEGDVSEVRLVKYVSYICYVGLL